MTQPKTTATSRQRHPDSDPSDGASALRKQPYEPPAIEESAPFETLALSCAKQEEVSACAVGPFFNS